MATAKVSFLTAFVGIDQVVSLSFSPCFVLSSRWEILQKTACAGRHLQSHHRRRRRMCHQVCCCRPRHSGWRGAFVGLARRLGPVPDWGRGVSGRSGADGVVHGVYCVSWFCHPYFPTEVPSSADPWSLSQDLDRQRLRKSVSPCP